VQSFFSKNVVTLKIHIFFFQLKAFQLKEKSQRDSSRTPSLAFSSAFIFVMVFVTDAHAAHAGFCFYVNGSSAVKTKPARAAPPLRTQKHTPKINALELYLHNASYTQPIFQRY